MRVKIGDKIYNSIEEPIMLMLDDSDKKNISNMGDLNNYGSFPEEMSIDDAYKFMEIEDKDRNLYRCESEYDLLTNEFTFLPYLEIQKGWFPLIRKLCEQIEVEIKKQNIVDFQISEVKQKYGELRIYCNYIEPVVLEHENNPIGLLIEAAVTEAKCICEFCGSNGKRKISNNWIYILCEDCLKIIQDKGQEQDE